MTTKKSRWIEQATQQQRIKILAIVKMIFLIWQHVEHNAGADCASLFAKRESTQLLIIGVSTQQW
jgi:hypothetical protein